MKNRILQLYILFNKNILYLKELIERIIMLADHIKKFPEYIQFLATEYLIFD